MTSRTLNASLKVRLRPKEKEEFIKLLEEKGTTIQSELRNYILNFMKENRNAK